MQFFKILLLHIIYSNNFMYSIERPESKISLDKRLRYAIWINDALKVKESLASGVNVNASDSLGTTPLMLAAMLSTCHSNKDILSLLLHAGGDIYQKNSDGESTLDYLCKDSYGAFTADQQAIRSELADHLVNEIRKGPKK